MTSHPTSQNEALFALSASQRIQLGELIDQYELSQDAGEALSLETLCDQSPDLLPHLITSLRRLRSFDVKLSTIPSLPIPEQIGEFQVIEPLGTGATGMVFRCRQKHPDREVAVKVLKPLLDVDEQQNRFRREMAAVSAIDETGMATVYQTGIVEWCGVRCLWIAMELLSGGTICEFIRAKQLSEQDRLQLFRTVCQTLRAAHRIGILHRDVKPSNILMSEDGQPHLVDFGVAKLPVTFDEIQQTETGVPAQRGTAAWMAPELLLADQPMSGDVRSEIFSLGVVLFEMISGQHPFAAERLSVAQVSARIVQRQPVRIQDAAPKTGPDLAACISKMMAFEPDNRYQNMDEVLSDLTLLQNGEPVKARFVPLRERTVRWCRRNWTSLSMLVILSSILVGVVSTILLTSYQLRRQAGLLAAANKELATKSEHLQLQTDDLRKALQIRDRSIRNGTLRSLQYVVHNSPVEVQARLNDATAFPEDSRGIAWQLLNHESRMQVLSLPNAGSAVGQLSFDRSGRYLLVTSAPNQLLIYDVERGLQQVSDMPVATASSIVTLPNGSSALIISSEGTLVEINLPDGKRLREFPHTTGMALRFAASADGQTVAGTNAEHVPFLADLESGKIRQIDAVTHRSPAGFWFSGNDAEVNCVDALGGWRKWSTETLKPMGQRNLEDGNPAARAVSVDYFPGTAGSAILAIGTSTGFVHLSTSDETANEIDSRIIHDGERLIVKLLSRSRLITAGSTLQVHSLYETVPPMLLPPATGEVRSIAVSADSRSLAVGVETGDVSIIDLQMPSILTSDISVFRDVDDLGFGFPKSLNAGGPSECLVVGHTGGWVANIDCKTLQPCEAFQICRGPVNSIARHPNGQWVVFGNGGADQSITVLQLSNKMRFCPPSKELIRNAPVPLRRLNTEGAVRKVCFSSDGRQLFAALRNGRVLVIDCEHWTIQRSFKIHDGGIFGMAVHKDLCVTGGTDGTLQITNLTDGTSQRRWTAHAKRITEIVVSPDGTNIFSASQDGDIRKWDFSGKLLHSLIAHVGPVTCVRLSADGATLLSGGQDHRILIWDPITGDLQREIAAHGDHVTALEPGPTGSDLFSVGLDGAVRLWGSGERE